MSRAPYEKFEIPISPTTIKGPADWSTLLRGEMTDTSSLINGNDMSRPRRAGSLDQESHQFQNNQLGRRLTWGNPSVRKNENPLPLLYRIISSPSEAMNRSTSLANYRKLLNDTSSVYSLLTNETVRDLYILSFQSQTRVMIDFLEVVKSQLKTFHPQNSTLATAFLDGVVLPLLQLENEDLSSHKEMFDLITISIRIYTICKNPPGLVTKLLAQLSEFPKERCVIEKFVCDPVCGALLVELMTTEKYTSVFRASERLMKEWTERLMVLVKKCRFDHKVSEAIEQWQAIGVISEAYPPSTAVTQFSGVKDTRTEKSGRRLSRDENKMQAGRSSRKLSISTENQPLVIPSEIETLITVTLESSLPRTLAAARLLAPQLRDEKLPGIFEAILRSFPCSTCQKLIENRSKYESFENKYHEEYQEGTSSEGLEASMESDQIHRDELEKLGIWRIVLSKQAFKDLSDAKKSGTFAIIQSKLKELASGNWEGRKALTKKHVNSDFPVPIRKVVYGDNGRIIWHVHVTFERDVLRAQQVILIWRIGNHKDVVKSAAVIARNQKTFGKEFIDACTLRIYHPDSSTVIPQTFGTEILKQEHITATLTRDESLDLHNAIITGKFYTLSKTVLDGILAGGSNAEFPFDVAQDEVEIIKEATSASFILGRSGTGKTTCLVFKLLSNYLTSKATGRKKPLRQIFITRSELLAEKLSKYIHRLIDCQLGRFENISDTEDSSDVIKEKDADADVTDFWDLKDEDFPLVCTFDNLLIMIERSIKIGERKSVSSKSQSAAHGQSKGLLRMPKAVEFEIFRRDYWERIPQSLHKNLPVDLVFSEIMGIIKGSTSSHTGLKALTRLEYITRSCRLAPLFTSEDDRQQVYDIYEYYERLKMEYRDWDGVDRAHNVFRQMGANPHIVDKLRMIMEEIYVDEIQDQRLLEIELLFKLIQYPRGVHLAGDTAQCISRDSTFRFGDLKALFFNTFQAIAKSTNDETLAKPKEFRLAQNYRSHQGIIALGALIIDCLWTGFPDLIDKLSPEVGKYTGPKPTFFAGFSAEDILLTGAFGLSDLYDQLADFGAEQVILVRDEEIQKDIHARIGENIFILTVLQSKGMEFEDVVLFNFFSGSGYIKHYRALDRLVDAKYGLFDPKEHAVLCSELKTLYVAVTRCRANLRIIEEDQNVGDMILNLWTEKVPVPLVDPVIPGSPDAQAKIKALRSGSSGNPEQWKSNGQHLMSKKLYKQALFCFKKTQHVQLQTIAEAHLRRQEAEELTVQSHGKTLPRLEIEGLYRESAQLFDKADHPHEATKSYEVAELFSEAADMWHRRSEPGKAAPLYEKAGDHSSAFKCYHAFGDYIEATMSLRRGELYDELVEYLESQQDVLDPLFYQRCVKLCNHYAHQGKMKPAHKTRSLKLLGSERKIELFYRQRGFEEELLQIFQKGNRLKDAFYYLVSTGQFQKAIQLAPFDELSSHVPPKEVHSIIKILLFSDLRKTENGELPIYANAELKFARPGLQDLWAALYRRLKHQTRIEKSSMESDRMIDGLVQTLNYIDFITLERIGDVLERVNDIDSLPSSSLSTGLEMVRDLINSTSNKVPENLLTYIGAYKQPLRSTYTLLLNSPLDDGSIVRGRLTDDMLFQRTRKWFANMVVGAAYAMLDKALRLWNNNKLGRRCLQKIKRGQCSYSDTHWGGTCPFDHSKLPTADFERRFEQIHELTKTTARLNFVYGKHLLDSKLAKDFRPKQRRWQETLLIELTYVSAINQNPVSIMESHIHQTAKKLEKFYQYEQLRGDLEHTLIKFHAKREIRDRSNFSELLEQLQRAQNFGNRARTAILHNLQYYCNSQASRYPGYGWTQRDTQHYMLFLNRPCLEGSFFRNVDNIPGLSWYFQQMRGLDPRHFSSFHAILSLCERVTTYLLLLIGRQDILVARSWARLHLPAVWPAYQRLSSPKPHTQELQAILDCFVQMIDLLLHVVNASLYNQVQFKYGTGISQSVPIISIPLWRRCFDVIIISILNMRLECSSEPQTKNVWAKTKSVLSTKNQLAGHRLGLNIPPELEPDGLLDCFLQSLAIYEGKESLCVLQRSPSVGLERKIMNTLHAYQVPVISITNQIAILSIRPIAQRDNGDSQLRVDATSTEGTSTEAEEAVFTMKQKLAAAVILKIWRHYWPLHKEYSLNSELPLGRATAFISSLNKTLRAIDAEGRYPETLHVIWLHGPPVYRNIMQAEESFHEVSERYQSFFGTLLGSNYSDEDLEEVEEYFEMVQAYEVKIKHYKNYLTVAGIMRYWRGWEVKGGKALQERLKRWASTLDEIVKDLKQLTENRFIQDVEV